MSIRKHSSVIFSIVGAAGVIATVFLAVKETPKAMKNIENMDENSTKFDIITETWRYYLPAAITGISTIAFIFNINAMNQKQKMAVISAYTLLERAYREYQAKTKELIGNDAESKIRASIANDHYNDSDICEDLPLFYDECSGEYFNSTLENIIIAEYELNREFAINGWVSVDTWYDLIGIKHKKDEDKLIGWSMDAAENFSTNWIEFEHDLVKLDDGLECWIIHTPYPPTADFTEYY